MKASVTKTFTFDAAHQIPNHLGKCRNLHGHTYHLEITCKGKIKMSDDAAPDYGMVVDFADIKDVWKKIEPSLDHKYLNETLPIPVTTAELIAAWVWEQFSDHGVKVSCIKLWETPTSYAEINNGDLI